MSILVQLILAAGILLVAITYIQGWRRWQRYRLSQSGSLSPEQMALYQRRMRRALIGFFAGLSLLGVVLLSPLYTYSTRYFSMRVAQHLLLLGWIPSLLLSSNPLPVLWQGMPRRVHGRFSSPPALPDALNGAVRFITAPGAAVLIFAGTFWLWYDPVLHLATLNYPWLRAIEIATLLGAAVLYWWHITGALPRIHPLLPWWIRVVYTFIGVVAIKTLGLIVMFTPAVLYPYPQDFYVSGLRVNDEMLGGIVFWIIGGTVYATTALLLIRNWLSREEEKPGLPESAWASEGAMLAPGLKK